jgi:tetratricopeptide (TPR) repeat protein
VELGSVLQFHDWDWTAADAAFRRALELAPGDADALRAAAVLARILGQPGKALELLGKAIAIDPLSARTHRQAGMTYVLSERYDEAAAAFELAIDLGPSHGLSHAFLAMIRLRQGRADEALAIAEQEPHEVFRNMALAIVRHAQGRVAESDAALRSLIERFGWTAAYQVADAYACRNEIDKAFEWLERAYAQRDPGVAFAATDIFMRPLHGDPRWRPFLERLRLA